MISESHPSDRIAELLVHLGRAVQSEDARSELTAAQWTCLRFFARSNGSTRTPSAFASFQATTRGTASQIIKSLERPGLVSRARSERDRRSVCFDLTDKGRAMLDNDPLRVLVGLIDDLDGAERAQVLTTLSGLASALAAKRHGPAFGTCRDCSHFGMTADAAYCACMAAELAADETTKLCASYAPMPENNSKGDRDAAG
ncbi:MAG: winged helix DNA-binding protein [Gammaproteobacteria bacterium]|jgi:DNA-binding MarR family transcriptional regulator|nr:winged helix DNA-binding protein [Gammaproteobacteria bacterium]